MEALDTLSDGLDMDPSMMSGFMKMSLTMPKVFWSSEREPVGYLDCFASIMHCPWALYA